MMPSRQRTDDRAVLRVSGVRITTPGGRLLFDGLDLSLSGEHVALVGRNGVGKSTLLSILARESDPDEGRVALAGRAHFVRQAVGATAGDPRVRSHGEQRKRELVEAMASGADVLLLDEPTEHLDDAGVAWLRGWLRKWPGCLLVASHDRRLLADFQHFFVVRESGCRAFSGTLAALDAALDKEHMAAEGRYAGNLHRQAAHEEHTLHIARRKARKKRYGRCRELDRATSRSRLNQKRSQAQVSHGRLAQLREARLLAIREWSRATRRALDVSLSLELPVPTLPVASGKDLLVVRDLAAAAHGVWLFRSLDVRLGRERLAIVGENGTGKTTLLEILLGRRTAAEGTVECDFATTGSIAQGGADWMSDESLDALLAIQGIAPARIAQVLVAHRFPLALAARPMRSLSPGERVRAALIGLFQRSPAVELLVLDEPTYSLDLVGQQAVTRALRAWPGGLVVASHDRAFLQEIGAHDRIELGKGSPR
jgi:ATPase subunit of ABC transporter with duplicated ATPase domains